jgi:hypothetical protein
VALNEDLSRIAAAAAGFAGSGEELAGIVPTEPARGERVYLCAFAAAGGTRSWLALDDEGRPVESRALVRDAVSIAALCELAEESAGGGRLDELRSQLVALRLTENPLGIEEAEEAALALQSAVRLPPRLASPGYLDEVGAATRRLERALDGGGPSPFAEAMKQAIPAVDALTTEVEGRYKRELR